MASEERSCRNPPQTAGAEASPHDSKIDIDNLSEHESYDTSLDADVPQPDDLTAAPPSYPKVPGNSEKSSKSSKSSKSPSPAQEQSQYTIQDGLDALDQAEQGIEPQSDNPADDGDGYESGNDSDSVSLATNAREFIYENGRRYHGYNAGYYSFPNDDREQDREDLKHAMYLLLFNRTLHFAPLEDRPMNVIDLGTGTGIWAIDFADKYPSADVLGIDLSPIQTNWVPPNLKFMVDDAEAEWLHPRNHFDYIHTRHTIQAFRNWPNLFSQAFDHLKPGGWIESQEINHFPECSDATLLPSNPILTYWTHVFAGLAALGVDCALTPRLAPLMRAAGFVNVTERVFCIPIGPWPKNRQLREVGLYWRAVLMEGLEAIALGPMTRGLGWRREEVEVFLVGVRKAYLEKGTHAWMPFYVVYGQKP